MLYSIVIEFFLKKLLGLFYRLGMFLFQKKKSESAAEKHNEAIKKGEQNEIEKSGEDVLNGNSR